MKENATFVHNGKEYKVVITRKRMKNIRYRLNDDTFSISAPYLASKSSIKNGLLRFADTLIAKQKPNGIGDNYIYIFGYRYPFSTSGELVFSNGQILKYSSHEDYEKRMRKLFLNYLVGRVRYYENIMQLKPHNVRVRKMNTRYGSNSKRTRTLSFALKLHHYSGDIIDAIVVHELAHSIHFDHSKAFYQVVYKYCPNYDALHKKLNKGVFL